MLSEHILAYGILFCKNFVQNVFTRSLESGDRQKAMKRLRVPPLGEKVGMVVCCVASGLNEHVSECPKL